jgi:PIN domain nuclease of toxin-antitoxin system
VIVLDSSALLAIALEEPGAGSVQAVAREAALSSANLAEILTVVERNGGDSEQIFLDIVALGVEIVPVSTAYARMAAQIWKKYPRLNLSLGDRLCLALAFDLHADVLTSDREMAKTDLGIHVALFR